MTKTRRTLRQLERIEAQAVIPSSLEEAFQKVQNLEAMHPHSRGTSYGAILTAAARGNGAGEDSGRAMIEGVKDFL